jgi:AraC-like DNA-binding protein
MKDSKKVRLLLLMNELSPNPQLRLRDLSKRISLSERQTRNLLKDLTGLGFRAHLRHLRLQNALDLLLKDCSVKYIASVVGYRDTSALDRDFSRAFGVSPTAYRRDRIRFENRG